MTCDDTGQFSVCSLIVSCLNTLHWPHKQAMFCVDKVGTWFRSFRQLFFSTVAQAERADRPSLLHVFLADRCMGLTCSFT